jgi:integrase
MRVALTDRFCASAKSTATQTDYFDAQVSGLALRVTAGGTRSWTLLHGTPRRRVTLGRYPSMSLAAARAKAIEIKDGRCAGTVAALAETYLRSITSLRSAAEIERRLRRDVLPVIGHIPLSELHRRDVTRVIDGKLTDAPITARRVFEDIRAMVRWAVARGDLDHSPIDALRGPPISKPRQRVLSDDEIRAVWHGLDEIRPDVAKVVRFCLVTGQRVGEVTGLRQTEIDLDRRLWLIPAERSKNGHQHSVPLSEMALEILETASEPETAIGTETDDGETDLVGETANNHGVWSVSRNVVSDIIWRYQIVADPWTAHDLRRTALTGMARLGVAPIVIGHVANHRTTTKAGITLGVYIQYEYEKEKRDALELWANRLQGIISGGAKVVALRRP